MAWNLGHPPGPIGWPLLGVLPQFRAHPAEFLQQTAQRYGAVSYFRLAGQRVYLVDRPDLIEEILVHSAASFQKTRLLRRTKVVLGDGLLTSEGDFHTRQRKKVQPAFYRERLASYVDTINACADRVQSRWTDGATLDIADQMMQLTLSVASRVFFGRDPEDAASGVGRAVTDLVGAYETLILPWGDLIHRFGLTSQARRANEARVFLDGMVSELIDEGVRDPHGRDDLLAMLLESGMPPQTVRDEVMTLMLAGHETTAVALTWTWYLLSQHPEVEERFHAELRRVLDGRLPTWDDIPDLSYTEQLLAEAMRLYPPAWVIAREARSQFRLFNYLLPRGAIIMMSPWATHRNPQLWPDPDRFDPERFTADAEARRPKFAYFPFGGGPRSCLGERFAWMEGILVLAAIGQRWRLRLAPGQRVHTRPLITLRPRYGMKMQLERVLA